MEVPPTPVAIDPITGIELFKYQICYRHEGRRYFVEIWATDIADAWSHLASLQETAWMAGQIDGEVD